MQRLRSQKLQPDVKALQSYSGQLQLLSRRIISCERCPRLRSYCEEIAHKKTRRYIDWDYWGKPVPGFGDPDPEFLIIGLAPAAHGANRTGRMFTGDGSGEWLIKALYENGFANQPKASSQFDGLRLRSVYVTAVVRCAPPKNKPTNEEIVNCSGYLDEELRILKNVRLVLTLGRVAFASYLRHVNNVVSDKPRFAHGKIYELGNGLPKLISSYHPSRQNTQTGRLTWRMWASIFRKAVKVLRTNGTLLT